MNGNNIPVWQLPVSGAEKRGNADISPLAKYHCFIDNVSLCGKHHQITSDYDAGITTQSACVLELPQFACQRCLKLWKKQYNVEG